MMEVVQPKAGRYLSFILNGHYYASPLNSVREIRQMGKFESVAPVAKYIVGRMTLQSGDIPVIDLKCLLGLGNSEVTNDTCILVINNGLTNVGIIVDAASDVVELSEKSLIAHTKKEDASGANAFTQGLGKMNEKLLIVMDLATAAAGVQLDQQGQVQLTEAS